MEDFPANIIINSAVYTHFTPDGGDGDMHVTHTHTHSSSPNPGHV